MSIRTRRGAFVTGLATLALLAGCSQAEDPAPEPDADQERTVTDASGADVTVPDSPERPVVLHYAATQAMLDLDVVPVGHAEVEEAMVLEEHWETVADVPVVTSGSEPDVEQIATLEPDIILAPNTIDEPVADQLGEIAPVFQFTLHGDDRGDWQHRVEEVAAVFGRERALDQLRADFEDRIDQIGEEYAEVVEAQTVTAIAAWDEGNVQVHGQGSMPGSLLVGVGFDWSPAADAETEREDYPETPVATEQLTDVAADADVLFYDSDLSMEVNEMFADVQESGLYERLPAVQDDRAYPFGKVTIAGFGDAHYSLDRIEDALRDMSNGADQTEG